MKLYQTVAFLACLGALACGSDDESEPEGFTNGDFELPGPTQWEASRNEDINGWQRIQSDEQNDVIIREPMNAQSGAHALKMWGPAPGLFQDVAASPGEVWHASVFMMQVAGDELRNEAAAKMQLSFVDGAGEAIGDPIDSDFQLVPLSEPAKWHPSSAEGQAPEGTAFARITLLKVGGDGAAWFEDAYLGPPPAAP